MTSPVTEAEFAALMAPLGPFEARPALAVAVSGGADSLALCLLAARWAAGRGGEAAGVTVDHGLRPESADEARRVGEWLAARGIRHQILSWEGDKPSSGIQAAARRVRHALLEAFCRKEGFLHLLLAHHREDQAETVALRRDRQSGPDGLAGMAAVAERPGVRLLRPLLGIGKDRLVATLAAQGQPWIEDPSNRDRRFARVRLRQDAPPPPEAEVEIREAGRARQAAETETARLLARLCSVHPRGFVLVDGAGLALTPVETARRALGRLLMAVGGRPHAPRGAALDRLLAALAAGRGRVGRTLGGCRLRPWRGWLRVEPEVRLDYSRPLGPPPPLSPLGFSIANSPDRTMS